MSPMSVRHTNAGPAHAAYRIDVKELVGSGDRIGLFTLPFLVVGIALNVARPAWFTVGGPAPALRVVSTAVLAVGLVAWSWSVALILIHVPRGRLITTGPYRVVKHPLYTSVALLVLPWLGFLMDTWLGVAFGIVLFVASRLFAPNEETALAARFRGAWDRYAAGVWLPWL